MMFSIVCLYFVSFPGYCGKEEYKCWTESIKELTFVFVIGKDQQGNLCNLDVVLDGVEK